MIQKQRVEVIESVDKYMKEHCDEAGRPRGSHNLTFSEFQGKREIIKGINENGWILYYTDKSGKLCLDTRDNYVRAMAAYYIIISITLL